VKYRPRFFAFSWAAANSMMAASFSRPSVCSCEALSSSTWHLAHGLPLRRSQFSDILQIFSHVSRRASHRNCACRIASGFVNKPRRNSISFLRVVGSDPDNSCRCRQQSCSVVSIAPEIGPAALHTLASRILSFSQKVDSSGSQSGFFQRLPRLHSMRLPASNSQ